MGSHNKALNGHNPPVCQKCYRWSWGEGNTVSTNTLQARTQTLNSSKEKNLGGIRNYGRTHTFAVLHKNQWNDWHACNSRLIIMRRQVRLRLLKDPKARYSAWTDLNANLRMDINLITNKKPPSDKAKRSPASRAQLEPPKSQQNFR